MIEIKATEDHELLASLNGEVQELHHHLYPQIFKPFNKAAVAEALRTFLENKSCTAFIAWDGSVAVGYMIVFLRSSGDNAFHYDVRTLYVDQIGVLSEHRNKGVGNLLLKKAEELAAEVNAQRLELDHWSANTVAATFFRRKGYVNCKERLWKLMQSNA
jgi:diamine N-acetyltransferase